MKDKSAINGQFMSENYWANAQTTYLAGPEYYDLQENCLRKLFFKYGPWQKGWDIGCGDGRYSKLASNFTESMIGIDIGSALLARARENSTYSKKVEFQESSVLDFTVAENFDLILCLGVISCMIDQTYFEAALKKIQNTAANKAILITKDTVAIGTDTTKVQGNYVARYRNKEEYIAQISCAGFTLIDEKVLVPSNNITVNSIFVFQKL